MTEMGLVLLGQQAVISNPAVALLRVSGKNLSHEQLTHLFMKIDANSDGTVDWDEFTNFMLLENQAATDMSDRSYSERLQETGPADLFYDGKNPSSAASLRLVPRQLARFLLVVQLHRDQ